MAKRKLDVSTSELLHMRESGLSNRDIANCLDISVATVARYIGPQGRRMSSLGAFTKPNTMQAPPIPQEEQKPGAVDSLEQTFEIVRNTSGSFSAEVDYENKCVSLLNTTVGFEALPELATFIIGLTARVNNPK